MIAQLVRYSSNLQKEFLKDFMRKESPEKSCRLTLPEIV
jgi:hypothetical protein